MSYKYHYKEYKTILSPQNGMNLYRGCTHGCIYCDSRSKCYGIDHDFEDIEVKANAPAILEAQLMRKRKKCVIGTGSMCDPYIPPERELRVTRQALEVIAKHEFGLSILTKSDLIMRDMDLLQSINRKSKCVVQMTLTTYDDELCKKIEPGVCTTSRRAEVLTEMKKAGIPTVVWLCPILPFINDTHQNLQGLLEYCLDAGVKGIICFGFGVTLREGSRDFFFRELDRKFPGLRERYGREYGNRYECVSPLNGKLYEKLQEFCRNNNIMYNTQDIFSYLREYQEEDGQLAFT